MMVNVNQSLALAGMLLFWLGLLNGFAIPQCRSPRLALSAHLTAVQSGTFLIAVGLLWPHIGMIGMAGDLTAAILAVSLYALWLALLLAGIGGAGAGLPIAGQGMTASRPYQLLVSSLLYPSLIGMTLATASIIYVMMVP